MRNVLYVEDDPLDVLILVRVFENVGARFTVEVASCGEDGLYRLCDGEQMPIDGVIADINMPGLGGVELTQAIRAKDDIKDLPIVIFSSSKLEADRRRALASGADGYIVKTDNDICYRALLHQLEAAALDRNQLRNR